MRPTNAPMRSTLPPEVSIIRKIFRQQRRFTQRNGCPGSISSIIELASSHRQSGPLEDRRGFNLISDARPFSRLWYGEPNAVSNAVDSRSFAAAHMML